MNTKLNQVENWRQLAKEATWSVSRLARSCGVMPRTLERYFRRNMGTSPKSWMIEQRQLMACKLLRDKCVSVKEAAMQLGYTQAQHFSQDFRKYWGVYPSQFGINVPKGKKCRTFV